MKLRSLIIITAATALLSACGTSKKLADTTVSTTTSTSSTTSNAGTSITSTPSSPIPVARFVSDIDLSIDFGGDSYSLDGKLCMKRDEVVRLTLTFMGFVEVGTIEFTPDNILIVNRIGKEYTRMPYNASDILVKNNITFANIQAMTVDKLYAADSKAIKDSGLDTALANMLNSNLKNGKQVGMKLKIGKPDTKRDFDTYTTVKQSDTEVPAQLLITKLMSVAK